MRWTTVYGLQTTVWYLHSVFLFKFSEWLEEALSEHDAEGNYFSIVKLLLHSYLRIDKEENDYNSDDDDDGSSSDNSNSPENKQPTIPDFLNEATKKASANASAAAAWTMLHQGMSLSDIAIEPFSLTEVLRLHILSSGVKIGKVLILIVYK